MMLDRYPPQCLGMAMRRQPDEPSLTTTWRSTTWYSAGISM